MSSYISKYIAFLLYLIAHEVFAAHQTTYPSTNIPFSAVFPSSISDLNPSDFSCWTSHVSYSLLTSSIQNAAETDKLKFTYSSTTVTTIGDYIINRPTAEATLCDGSPRVTGLATPTGSARTTTQTIRTVWTSTWMPLRPTCTVESYGKECRSMYSSLASITSRLSASPQGTPSTTIPSFMITPPCRTPDTYPNPTAPISCSLVVSTYKVLYWPVTMKGDFCGTQSTIPPTPTISGKPNTALYSGLTITSPTIYYVLDNMHMQTFAGLVNGNRALTWMPLHKYATTPPPLALPQDPVQIPVSSAIISCNLGRQCFTTLQPFAFEHLSTAPARQYQSLIGGSDIIYQGYYAPFYTLPTALPTAGNGWEMCNVMFTGAIKPTYINLLQPTSTGLRD
ncbi:hypothetical protein B0J11DRAFT_581508 [Dendryphion nanum]|uniref:Uncharacterized protein n=1 Tax=Dendryphion nanum TaxID=256645 RepID=A0A9P9DP64_9PLEO|nr:hypothetical protein B0J11DRAFT_581508 [Dendryphion nanum]